MSWRTPGFVTIEAGTVVNNCCGPMKRVGNSRPSMTMRTAGVNLSPVSCKLKSAGVRAYTEEDIAEHQDRNQRQSRRRNHFLLFVRIFRIEKLHTTNTYC